MCPSGRRDCDCLSGDLEFERSGMWLRIALRLQFVTEKSACKTGTQFVRAYFSNRRVVVGRFVSAVQKSRSPL